MLEMESCGCDGAWILQNLPELLFTLDPEVPFQGAWPGPPLGAACDCVTERRFGSSANGGETGQTGFTGKHVEMLASYWPTVSRFCQTLARSVS